jgi:hypothetical protein|tara:strand:- start:1534 stop:1947 length:414 start_codon:yes stop_codon:yes gene_type:complete
MVISFTGGSLGLVKHSEKEYLELEKNFKSLFIAVGSLMTITEVENPDVEVAFNALGSRINQIYEEHQDFKGGLSIQGHSDQDSAHMDPLSPSYLIVDDEEKKMIVESLHNMACMYSGDRDAKDFESLANEIEEKKND